MRLYFIEDGFLSATKLAQYSRKGSQFTVHSLQLTAMQGKRNGTAMLFNPFG
jgi:hypothetical protein